MRFEWSSTIQLKQLVYQCLKTMEYVTEVHHCERSPFCKSEYPSSSVEDGVGTAGLKPLNSMYCRFAPINFKTSSKQRTKNTWTFFFFFFFSALIVNPFWKIQVTLPTFCFGPMNSFLEITIIVSFIIYISLYIYLECFLLYFCPIMMQVTKCWLLYYRKSSKTAIEIIHWFYLWNM